MNTKEALFIFSSMKFADKLNIACIKVRVLSWIKSAIIVASQSGVLEKRLQR